jgi:hypothetical protein
VVRLERPQGLGTAGKCSTSQAGCWVLHQRSLPVAL